MSLRLYMDHHVPAAVTEGLRRRDVDIITAYEDGASRLDDPDLLTRATSLHRVLVSMDEDLPTEAARRQRHGEHYAGLVYARQSKITVGRMVEDLEIMAKVCEADEMLNETRFLPI